MAYSLIVSIPPVGGANGATTVGATTTGANLITVFTSSYNLVGAPTLTDSNSNTWTALTTFTSTGARVIIYYCFNPIVGASHTFTLTGTGTFSAVGAKAWSGSTTGPFDQQNGNNFNSSATGIQPGSVTPSQNNELVVTCLGMEGSSPTPTINSSFVGVEYVNYVGGSNFSLAFASLIQTAAGAINPTWSFSSTNNQAVAIATFKASGSVTIDNIEWNKQQILIENEFGQIIGRTN